MPRPAKRAPSPECLKPQDVQRLRDAQACFARRDLDGAERLCAELLAQRPGNFDALYLLGAIKHAQGHLAAALDAIGRALAANPRSPEVLINHGMLLARLARRQDALASFDQAIALRPAFAEAYNGRGCVLLDMARPADALASFTLALEIRPDDVEALNNRGHALVSLHRSQEAIADLATALRLRPNHALAHYNMGNALAQLGRHADAVASYDRALALAPGHAEAHCNRATALQELGRVNEARDGFEAAIARKPTLAAGHNGLGAALRALGDYRAALACFARAIELQPDLAEAHVNKGQTQLLLGELPAGWGPYERRWDMAEFAPQRRDVAATTWRGREPIDGKTLLLHAEQGFGDTLQFVRYADVLAARGATIVIEAPPALKRLLAMTYPHVVARGEPLPPLDYCCPMLSAAFACATDLASIPAAIPYLAAAEADIGAWAARVPRTGRLRIGLTWSGTAARKFGHDRSVPLAALAPLLALDDIQWISLQKEVRETDRAALAAHPNLIHCADALTDFAATAALIATLDLVISTDTAVAHLAGGLGKPTWIMLARVPDFRWLLERDDSPWYPTARLFRQAASGNWTAVVDNIRGALAHHRRG
ncbi:MAG TPA: tetratricopeptide repeat protein [Xanthobacteraceae bacterium]|nr:tetratricopeptide repeat protein [Xanthobacteraceae bacterium]